MGNTYTVCGWGKHGGQEYRNAIMWSGESLLTALLELVKAKRKGFGCVTLEWR